MCTICVDAMGGDCEPSVVLEGIKRALDRDQSLKVLVVGDEHVVVPFCQKTERALPLISYSSIGMDEHATNAFRKKRDSSLVIGLQSVKRGEADGFFSAGNTGAILTAATFIVGRLKGVSRPCVASFLPGLGNHETIVTDLGANADCRPEMIVGFARLGVAYAQHYFKRNDIRLGLLSNGSEDIKGNECTLAAHRLLRESNLHFCGNAEGTDLLLGDFDCVVTDGFTGNCALKTLEGTAKFMALKIKEATKHSVVALTGAALLKPVLKDIAAGLSGDEHGGAVLLGVKAPVFIGHGHTSPVAVMNGIKVAAAAHREHLVEDIAKAI